MGCTNSKLDDLPAVSLCRHRLTFLHDAIRHRHLLAESHLAYLHSLKQVGHSLHNFVTDHAASSSPELNLPPPAKKADTSGADSTHAHHSHSNSAGHIEFRSDPDDDEESGSGHSSPLHDHEDPHNQFHPDENYMRMMGGEMFGGYTNMHVNYMKNEPKSSVVYQQKPMSPETVQYQHMRGPSYPYPYPYPYPDSSSTSYSYFGYPNPTNPPQPPGYGLSYAAGPEVASSSKPPPPPPSPPQASPWEFLNPFETYDKYYPSYTPSRDSKELRQEEGIPDLEDEEFGHEPVKKVHVAEKFVDGGGGGGDEGSISSVDSGGDAEESLYQTRPSVDDHEGVEYEVHVVEKKVVDDGERREEQMNAGRPNSRDPADVAREIEVHFVRAADTGGEIVQILEVGKLPYGRKHGTRFQVMFFVLDL